MLGACAGWISGRKINDSHKPVLGGECQDRPNRPLPPICFSAITIAPSGAPFSAQRKAVTLVDLTEKCDSISRPIYFVFNPNWISNGNNASGADLNL